MLNDVNVRFIGENRTEHKKTSYLKAMVFWKIIILSMEISGINFIGASW
jgi:hypothetical protein